MPTYFYKHNKLALRRERLEAKAIVLRNEINSFKESLGVYIEDMTEMLASVQKDIEDIDIVMTRPKKERTKVLFKQLRNEIR